MKNTKEYYDKTAKEMADKWYEDEYLLPYLKEFIETYINRVSDYKDAGDDLEKILKIKKL